MSMTSLVAELAYRMLTDDTDSFYTAEVALEVMRCPECANLRRLLQRELQLYSHSYGEKYALLSQLLELAAEYDTLSKMRHDNAPTHV